MTDISKDFLPQYLGTCSTGTETRASIFDDLVLLEKHLKIIKDVSVGFWQGLFSDNVTQLD